MIVVNGENVDLQAGVQLTSVLARLGLTVATRGVAIAVDGEVVPRAGWKTFTLGEDARVEVLTAMQGG
jgi:sulfur carrier protein